MNLFELINDPIVPIKCFHCSKEEYAVHLLKELSLLGYKWYSGRNLSDINEWQHYKQDTCYFLDARNGCIVVDYCHYILAVEIFGYVLNYTY